MTDRPDPRPRSDAERLADHDAIGRLADDLLPALVAKLAASGLGELEVHEAGWHVRLRMPPGEGDRGPARRAGAPVRTGAAGPGVAAQAGDPATGGGPTSTGAAGPAAGALEGRGPAATPAMPDTTSGRARGATGESAAAEGQPRPRAVAASPAVGIYRVRQGVTAGSRVRGGDRIGIVDVLGVPHDVVAPEDGIVGASYVEDGEGVEYGQELVRIETSGESSR